jgi:hypothetical protein
LYARKQWWSIIVSLEDHFGGTNPFIAGYGWRLCTFVQVEDVFLYWGLRHLNTTKLVVLFYQNVIQWMDLLQTLNHVCDLNLMRACCSS